MSLATEFEKLSGYRIMQLSDLIKLEECLGCVLPVDYRDFLIKNNGGYPNEQLIELEDEPGEYLRSLYGLGVDESEDLAIVRAHLSKIDARFYSEFLAIGSDYFGNAFCISLKEKTFGKIFFWDHESHEIDIMVESFKRFILELKPDTEDR